MSVATLRAQISTPTYEYGGKRSALHELLEDDTFEVGTFKRRLSETIEWCKPRVSVNNPANCLRTAALRPEGWPPENRMQRQNAEELFQKRERAIQGKTPIQQKDLEDGRLLVFFPDFWLYEGVAAIETRDFIDFAETPPWDTWVYYGIVSRQNFYDGSEAQPTEYLMTWIPKEFLQLVDDALWALSCEPLWWVDDTQPELF